MKIVQSFWSCNQTNLLLFNAGWYSPEYHLMSWALSCLQLKQFYPVVTLHADSASARMLIDTLKLPYDNVVCDLNCLDKYHPKLWALPKIHTYSKQRSPFLHVDGDVFIWSQFDENLLQGNLIAQNEESATIYYENILNSLEEALSYFPPEIVAQRKLGNPVHAFNAGIFGGNDIEFIKEYAVKAFKFVDKNILNLSKINISNFNIFFEQYLFYCLVLNQKKKVSVLIDKVIGDNEYTGLGEFIDVPHEKKYLHLLGDYKRNDKVCLQMALRLREDYPEYYYRIIHVFNEEKVPIAKNYYWFEPDLSEQKLLAKHYLLQHLYLSNQIELAKYTSDKQTNSFESIFYRTSKLEFIFKIIENNESLEMYVEKINQYMVDVKMFEDSLFNVVFGKFSSISRDYLLGRDICNTQYSKFIFNDSHSLFEKKIVKDSLVQIVKSKFDWTILDNYNGPYENTHKLLIQEPSEVYTLIIPECDERGYSLSSIDTLDILILEIVEEQKTILELFDQLKPSFDSKDLEESRDEFEKLILGRIKNGIKNKSIKAILPLAV